MTRKPAPLSAKSRLAKRTVAKHKARKEAARFAWLRKGALLVMQIWHHPLVRRALANPFWGKTFWVPKLNIELPIVATAAFVGFLVLASGLGYMGAKTLFGTSGTQVSLPLPPQLPAKPAQTVIQQTHGLRGVILPEPPEPSEPSALVSNAVPGNTLGPPLAYEEKALVEVYEPSPHADVAKTEPPGDERASVTPVPHEPNLGPQPLWLKNAIAFTPPDGLPMIAIVIDDMGVDRNRSEHMWDDIPAPLTLSFMTYAHDLDEQTQAARARGHELMLHMPMEPSSVTIDAGPNVLMTTMPDTEIRNLANWGMDRFAGFIGVNNHMGSHFTEDSHAMHIVLQEIQKRGLLYLDSRTSSHTVGPKVARELGMAALERNVFLDNDNVPAKVLNQLQEVERLARQHGHAIAIGHPRDATIRVLKDWIPEARARGLAIVPISTLMKDRLQRQAAKRRVQNQQ